MTNLTQFIADFDYDYGFRNCRKFASVDLFAIQSEIKMRGYAKTKIFQIASREAVPPVRVSSRAVQLFDPQSQQQQ